LTLVASDSLNENETSVVIRINDVNDLPPVFSQSLYTSAIEEEYGGPLPLKLLKVDIDDAGEESDREISNMHTYAYTLCIWLIINGGTLEISLMCMPWLVVVNNGE
jgi:hypothetical protein